MIGKLRPAIVAFLIAVACPNAAQQVREANGGVAVADRTGFGALPGAEPHDRREIGQTAAGALDARRQSWTLADERGGRDTRPMLPYGTGYETRFHGAPFRGGGPGKGLGR
jgi:hypothetical protein